MRHTVGIFCCILFLWPCLSTLTGQVTEGAEGLKILATPEGEGEKSGISVWYYKEPGNEEYFLIRGMSLTAIPQMYEENISEWVNVYASDSSDLDLPPVLGRYELSQNRIYFYPKFELHHGMGYRVELSSELASILHDSVKNPIRTFTVALPKEEGTPVASVSAIYPSRSELPENLLKFYIHFSHPMSVGNVYDYIHLLNEDGKEVELPFLELGEELWDYDSQRLTLLFDPGRIKTGLVPNIQEGLALHAGRSYTLKIDADWQDAQGQPMLEGFEKAFTVTAGDTISPNPYNWKKSWPRAETKEPIVLTFPESLDEALLQRLFVVQNRLKQVMNGSVKVSDHETRWEFTPAVNWQAGKYRLLIETILEDVAGNSIARPFELEKSESENYRAGPAVVHLDFEVR